MNLRQTFLTFILSLLCVIVADAAVTATSPDQSVRVTVDVHEGQPTYSITWRGQTIIAPSRLGLLVRELPLHNLRITSTDRCSHDETWVQPWGEEDSVRCNYNELVVHLRQSTGRRTRLTVTFRVFNDGVGFRYSLSRQQRTDNITVDEELTEFCLPADVQAWSIPTNHTEYYEGVYERAAVSTKDTVCTPITLEYGPNLYVAIHEAARVDYATLNLTPRGTCLLAALTPWQSGVKVYAKGSLRSPWRTVIFADTPGGLVTNRVMLNLNEPCRLTDTSWIEPGKYLGIWWSIHKKQATWETGPRHGATTQNVKRYIDFAAAHGFQGVLSEGWNEGWGTGEKVSFLRPYPDFDIEGVCRYARSRGVRWIGHTETWGHTRLLEEQMDSAFAWMSGMGVNTVKTGYVGHMFDGQELPGSQYGIRHYSRVIECAARHHLMVDNHEPAMPTGLQRTWPNLMTQEGVRGQEYNAWDRRGGNQPNHTVTLPFTRGLAGPMDYTPAIFDFSEVVEGTHPHTTIARQLAEFVVLYSPLQMAADAIENYESHPAFSFIEKCPTDWSRTLVPHGAIGQYITVCRRERGGDRWFVGSMTNDEARELSLSLDFLDEGYIYRVRIYEDGPDADYESAPMSLAFRELRVRRDDSLTLRLARGGGAAVCIERLAQ